MIFGYRELIFRYREKYGKPFGFLFSISRYRELFPDIGNSNSRYREINFRYREIIDFPISGNDFRISAIDFPISGNVFDFPISGNQFPISREINSRYPKIARQKQVTPPPCNTALPHRPLSTKAPAILVPSETVITTSVNHSVYTYICKTRSVPPTIIIQPII